MSGQSCQRPGCAGTYEDVGGGELYCGVCGLAPVVSASGYPPLEQSRERGDGMVGSVPTGAVPGWGALGSRSSASGRSSRSSRSSTSRRSVSGRLSRSLSHATSRSVSVRASASTGASGPRSRLGAGLVLVPAVPRPEPQEMVSANPEVPERKRFCSRADCGAPVGRARGEKAGRTEGFCTKCGYPYSFVPKLNQGDVVHGQYEVVGCIAHGGLGWVYLAVDRAVSDRWVVLKGLLDTGDEEAMAAAISERRFLAEIEHSNIVRIYNFVEHLDKRTGSLDGYIVMEYVGGKSLKEIANGRRTQDGKRDPLPVEQACAYGIEALEALGHLHSRNLLYCDFKVDNAIQTEDQLKLIDMGAVRRMDDDESTIYGTVGYQAPEVPEVGPSVASDLYTVARTLAVLTFDFQGYTNVFADSLPDADSIPVFREYESFYRLLVRATDPDPARRFASAQEMAEQLTGVLREVVALQSGRPRPSLSTLFGPETKVTDTQLFAQAEIDGAEKSRAGLRPPAVSLLRMLPGLRRPAPGTPGGGAGAPDGAPAPVPPQSQRSPQPQPSQQTQQFTPSTTAPVPSSVPGGRRVRELDVTAAALALPAPRVDAGDANAGFLAGLLGTAPADLLAALQSVPVPSTEARLRELRARLELGQLQSAARTMADLELEQGDDWRVVWYRGMVSLATGDDEGAALSFDAVYDAFPGEPAPKLALGLCAEVLGQLDNAAEYYRLVWSTDPSYVSAAFSLARVQLDLPDRGGAVATLESVPESSIHFTAARVAAVRARLREIAAQDGQRPVHAGQHPAAGGHNDPGPDALAELGTAARQVEALNSYGLDAVRRERLSAEVLAAALDWVLSTRQGAAGPDRRTPQGAGRASAELLGCTLDEQGLRSGLERSYRTLARLAEGDQRIELVERANRFRPRTWV